MVRLSAMVLFVTMLAACDVAGPEPDRIVVEAFVETGAALPTVVVRHTASLDEPDAAPPVSDAEVLLTLDGEPMPYQPVAGAAGTYAPVVERTAEVGGRFALDVAWQGQRAVASSRLPEPITLDSVRVVPSAAPVEAVFAD